MPNTFDVRLTRLEGEVKALARQIEELDREINGPTRDPQRKSMRTRLHELEDVRIAGKAVEAAIALNASTNEAAAARRDRRIALIFSALALLASVLLFFFR